MTYFELFEKLGDVNKIDGRKCPYREKLKCKLWVGGYCKHIFKSKICSFSEYLAEYKGLIERYGNLPLNELLRKFWKESAGTDDSISKRFKEALSKSDRKDE